MKRSPLILAALLALSPLSAGAQKPFMMQEGYEDCLQADRVTGVAVREECHGLWNQRFVWSQCDEECCQLRVFGRDHCLSSTDYNHGDLTFDPCKRDWRAEQGWALTDDGKVRKCDRDLPVCLENLPTAVGKKAHLTACPKERCDERKESWGAPHQRLCWPSAPPQPLVVPEDPVEDCIQTSEGCAKDRYDEILEVSFRRSCTTPRIDGPVTIDFGANASGGSAPALEQALSTAAKGILAASDLPSPHTTDVFVKSTILEYDPESARANFSAQMAAFMPEYARMTPASAIADFVRVMVPNQVEFRAAFARAILEKRLPRSLVGDNAEWTFGKWEKGEEGWIPHVGPHAFAVLDLHAFRDAPTRAMLHDLVVLSPSAGAADVKLVLENVRRAKRSPFDMLVVPAQGAPASP